MKKHMSKIMLFLACLVIVACSTTVYAKNNFDNEYVGQDFCQKPGVQASMNILSWIILIAKLMIPIIIIIFGTLDLYKVVISGNAGDVPKAAKSLGYRIALGVFIFFLPTLIRATIGYLLPSDYNTCVKCLLQPGSCKGNIIVNPENFDNNSNNDSYNNNNNNSNNNSNNNQNNGTVIVPENVA